MCSLDDDREAALDAARLLVTQYLGQQPHIMKASGVPADAARRDRPGAHLAGDPRRGRGRVEARARRGRAADVRGRDAEECRAKVAEYVAAGCTCPILYPLGDVEATLEAFAP